MQAEDNYSNGNLQPARDLYSSAISFAKQHRFLNDESLVSNDDAIELPLSAKSSKPYLSTLCTTRHAKWLRGSI